MVGGGRLILIFVLMLLVGAVYAASESAGAAAAVLPKAEPRRVQEDFHGTKVVDKYRWLEDGNSADTQKWVAEEMAYSRALLDPLPGRDAIHKRLTELLSIGSIGVPQIGGKYFFYTRGEGMQNQPSFFVGCGVGGKNFCRVVAN